MADPAVLLSFLAAGLATAGVVAGVVWHLWPQRAEPTPVEVQPLPSSLRLWWDCSIVRYWLTGTQQVSPRTRAEARQIREWVERDRREAAKQRPIEHHGAEDDAQTSEWLHEIATVPTDPWDAMLAEFASTWEVELAAHDERFFSEIGEKWAVLVRRDQVRGQAEENRFKRAQTQEFLKIGGELEDTQQLSVVGVG